MAETLHKRNLRRGRPIGQCVKVEGSPHENAAELIIGARTFIRKYRRLCLCRRCRRGGGPQRVRKTALDRVACRQVHFVLHRRARPLLSGTCNWTARTVGILRSGRSCIAPALSMAMEPKTTDTGGHQTKGDREMGAQDRQYVRPEDLRTRPQNTFLKRWVAYAR